MECDGCCNQCEGQKIGDFSPLRSMNFRKNSFSKGKDLKKGQIIIEQLIDDMQFEELRVKTSEDDGVVIVRMDIPGFTIREFCVMKNSDGIRHIHIEMQREDNFQIVNIKGYPFVFYRMAHASLDNGVLEITLPKKKPLKIQ